VGKGSEIRGLASLKNLGFPRGIFAKGYLSGVGLFVTELFPTALCGSGLGFCNNFGRGLGALFPAVRE